ncbi:hypothetical protein ACRAWD_30000 [Caulobacter segnis]
MGEAGESARRHWTPGGLISSAGPASPSSGYFVTGELPPTHAWAPSRNRRSASRCCEAVRALSSFSRAMRTSTIRASPPLARDGRRQAA